MMFRERLKLFYFPFRSTFSLPGGQLSMSFNDSTFQWEHKDHYLKIGTHQGSPGILPPVEILGARGIQGGWEETQRNHYSRQKLTWFFFAPTGTVNETYIFCIMKQRTNWANLSINEPPVMLKCADVGCTREAEEIMALIIIFFFKPNQF